jgi:MerR family transcriptional regulator/heat shock protein HspR
VRNSRGIDEPCFVMSIAAQLVGVGAQTMRYYERVGLITPSRSGGNVRLYSRRDVERLRRIRTFVEDMGVNLAGAEVIMRLVDRIRELEARLEISEKQASTS